MPSGMLRGLSRYLKMESEQYDRPVQGEIEVSLFGPGYGECIAIHLPDGKWIVIDSCREPNTRQPAALRYFNIIGVSVESDVDLIIATHWHDDHIRGLSDLVSAFENARLVVSGALTCAEFEKLIALYRRGAMVESSGVDEFRETFRILEERKANGTNYQPLILASENKLIFRKRVANQEIEVWSLSPSSRAQLDAAVGFSKILPEIDGRRLRVPSQSPNNASVVMWIQINDRKLLFGADLEKTSDKDTGWTAILDHNAGIASDGEFFKIPHHGSENADHPRVWDELLNSNPFAGLTPFRLGSKALPNGDDVTRINSNTKEAYLTAPPRRTQPNWHRRVVRDMIEQATAYMESTQFGWGHIRFRTRANESPGAWDVDLFGDAHALAAN